MAAVIICSDFGAQANKIYHCFRFFPIYLPWSEGIRCHDLSFLNLGPLISSHAFCGGGLVAQSYPTLCDPMDCSPRGSSVLGISQARILEWVTISFSRGSSQPRDLTHISCVAHNLSHCRRILYQLSHQGSPSFWQSSWNWSYGDLICIILIVLSTVNLQFQGQFVPISLRPVIKLVAAYGMSTVWSSCS